MTDKIKPPVKKEDGWWVPRCPPNFFRSAGPYDTRAEAESDRRGMQRTIDSPSWRRMIEEMERTGEEGGPIFFHDTDKEK